MDRAIHAKLPPQLPPQLAAVSPESKEARIFGESASDNATNPNVCRKAEAKLHRREMFLESGQPANPQKSRKLHHRFHAVGPAKLERVRSNESYEIALQPS